MNDLLLVIDMQNVYLPDQPWACETVAHTKANILKLLEKNPENQTIFTRYIAAEHPVGTWKTYNELNRKINEDPWMNELMDGIKEEKDEGEELLNHMFLNTLLGTLEEKERRLLHFRYFEEMTQVQVAEKMKMTQVQVSRLEKKILEKLREKV